MPPWMICGGSSPAGGHFLASMKASRNHIDCRPSRSGAPGSGHLGRGADRPLPAIRDRPVWPNQRSFGGALRLSLRGRSLPHASGIRGPNLAEPQSAGRAPQLPVVAVWLQRPLARYNGPSFLRLVRQVIGLCRHWGGSASTSAMWRIADSGGIEQSDGSFLHQRTHTPDPEPSFGHARRTSVMWAAAGENQRLRDQPIAPSPQLYTDLFPKRILEGDAPCPLR
jgi:hypothetical protein